MTPRQEGPPASANEGQLCWLSLSLSLPSLVAESSSQGDGWSSNHSAIEVHAAPEGHKPGPQLPSAVTCGAAPRSRLAGASHEGRHIEAGDGELRRRNTACRSADTRD